MQDGSERSSSTQRALVGAGIAAETAGALFLWKRKVRDEADAEPISDAPPHVLRGKAARSERDEGTLFGRTVTIGRPSRELYDAWKDFTRFPSFMENVERVERLDEKRSRWTIKGPAGREVQLVTRIVEDVPGRRIAWESEEGSDVAAAGAAEFEDAPPGRGSYVRLLMRYDPPGGALGRGIAKLFQREPGLQARHDLRRLKQLMETGEVTVNASPSARSSEKPTQARI